MATRSEVLADIARLRQALRIAGNPHLPLLELEPWRPLRDVALDLIAIAAALWAALSEPWTVPLVLLVLGNRQRALGNVLHDAAHRNLTRDRQFNDLMTRALIAPVLFVSLARYRALHFQHHLDLGCEGADPDLIPIPSQKADSWVHAVAVNVLSWRAIVGSIFGHLFDEAVPVRDRRYIVVWWAVLCSALSLALGPVAAGMALLVWLIARGTTFHAITTYREMCDHHGMTPGGVFSFTRDLLTARPWTWLFHPRNNGYHLTHHLLPAIPYYRLPDAQRLFATLEPYQDKARVCSRYFDGKAPVVSAWQQGR